MATLAGYRPLRKRDFAVSSIAMFGLVGRQKVALARKPVKRLFALPGGKARHLDISFVTDTKELARGAVDVRVRYLAMPGRRAVRCEHHQLFADPSGKASPQRLWLMPPPGTRFAEVSFSRAVRGARVIMDGRLKLQSTAKAPTLSQFDDILASRDLTAMELLFGLLEETGDRARAHQLIVRMRTLAPVRRIAVRQESLRDAAHILEFGPNYQVPGVVTLPAGDGHVTYSDNQLAEDMRHMPLGKALVADALRLFRTLMDANAHTVDVSAGPSAMAGLLVTAILKQSCPHVGVTIPWGDIADSSLTLGPWLSFDKGTSFLETSGGSVVHSCLAGAHAG